MLRMKRYLSSYISRQVHLFSPSTHRKLILMFEVSGKTRELKHNLINVRSVKFSLNVRFVKIS